jgi:UDP-glucose 4-epimerase
MQLLVTGATGKVGVNLIERLLSDPRWRVARVRALCHNRTIPENDRIEVVKGSIDHRGCVDRAMRDVTHVVHLATCKEIPETVMDVTVKGLFWLLEAFRQSTTAKQFMLIGGDAAVGHFFYDHQEPITEHTPHRGLSRLLRSVEGPRGGDAVAVCDSVRHQHLLFACAVDHGKGRLSLLAIVR